MDKRIYKDGGARLIGLLQILQTETDENHHLSMNELIALLNQRGIKAARKAVYESLKVLQDFGYEIIFTRANGVGYYLKHTYRASEVLLLADLVMNSESIDLDTSKTISDKLFSQLSKYQQNALLLNPPSPSKTDNRQALATVTLLLEAIEGAHPVSFLYFDLNFNKTRTYRRNKTQYTQIPYAVTVQNGRYYGIFYSENHRDFSIFRIDKMDEVTIHPESVRTVPFDLAQYVRSTFNMYKGDLQTIQITFNKDMEALVLDQFGDHLIITKMDENSFTAAITTAVTPTLIGWLLQFEDRLTILKPQSLIQELLSLAEMIQSHYGG